MMITIKKLLRHKKSHHFIKNDGLSMLLATIILVLLVTFIRNKSFIDFTVISSIVIAWMINILSRFLKEFLLNLSEDNFKLTSDYIALSKKYIIDERWVRFTGKQFKEERIFPVLKEFSVDKQLFLINDSPAKQYKLPEISETHFSELFSAHTTSTIYNQLAIRVDDWSMTDKGFVINTSRTTYFDSLVTNRVMDYELENSLTIREMLQYGPFFPELKQSQLSNHLGFNGFIESSDGYFLFIKRSGHNSIGKFTLGNSVAASLKAKYALKDGVFTADGLQTAIVSEIFDETKIRNDELVSFSLADNVIAAYRDVLEGGKPQLLFYAKSLLTRESIEKNSLQRGKKKNKKKQIAEELTQEDGTNFYWIHKDELSSLEIFPDKLMTFFENGKISNTYQMFPSASAALVMLIEHLKIG